ncbi:alpha/beta fold hydrolase [Micromonospora radicis]|uniref:Alpha/beta hydrolase n=1 Tax=Micromonospora radicis TaxID=1894971 RepID=A0A418MXW5_9ACTN|nr:alpha/beta hydrolase [Micromonospora radicis]RIV39961.1 alpha/beta hydrolase [Micromonospora radicis]
MSTSALVRPTGPELSPLPPGVVLPSVEEHLVTVPAPATWRERAGRRAAESWQLRGLRWGVRSVRPPIVLVHGLGVAARMVAPTARRLAVGGLVLAPDLPGYGRSGKPRPVPRIGELGAALTSWLTTTTAAPAMLVGVSLGSQIVIDVALRNPAAVRALVLVSPIVEPERRSWRRQLWRWQQEQATQSLRLRAIQLDDYRRAGLGRVVRTFSSALAQRPEEKVGRLRMPVLICRGSRDPLVSASWVRQLRARCGGELVTVPGAVHAMSYENPVELSRVVQGFLDRIEGRPAAGEVAGVRA